MAPLPATCSDAFRPGPESLMRRKGPIRRAADRRMARGKRDATHAEDLATALP
jgi:hypothetical protein